MRRSGWPEFARAEAYLRAKRIVARREQEREGVAKRRPTIRGRSSSPRCLSVLPTDSDSSNLSNPKSLCLGREELDTVGPADPTPLAQPRSRFLKQKPQDVQQAGLHPVTHVGFGAASKERPNAILRKLAQIESKIQSRKPRQSNEQIPVLDDELSLSESSNDFEFRTRNLKFLKKTARLKENDKAQTKNVTFADTTGHDSEADADRYRQGVPKKSKGQEDKFKSNGKSLPETSSNLRFLPEERSVKRPLPHSPSSPNRNTRASYVASCSSPPSIKGSPADTMSHNRSSSYQRRSLSEQNIVRSLDELFSDVTDIHNDTSSNSDFRVNILSLDELEPCQKTELKEEVIQAVEKSNENSGRGIVLFPANAQSPFKTSTVPLKEEENLEETEISEQLNSNSAGCSSCKEESLTEYSDDFEFSSFSAPSKETEGESSSETSYDLSGPSIHSIQSDLSSPCCSSVASGSTKTLKKVEVKEAAVQAGSFSLAYHGLQYDVPVAVGQTVEQSSVEAPHISSHKLNVEVIEALSMYSPSISALNNMLKQNLLLIQQSVEINRHLHASFVASLEEEEYHYHTLEEAKMYIEQHKPLPLTMEQALQELKEQEQMAS